jgi:hypothetical protein
MVEIDLTIHNIRVSALTEEMARRIPMLALTVALLTVLVALTPLAYAAPPDPTWVSGFFDDDDNDNGVFLVTSSQVTLDAFPLRSWTPFPVFGRAVASEGPGTASTRYFSTADARAPPLS